MPTFTLFVALSPDGKNLAFSHIVGAGGYAILLRPLDRLEATPVPGTDDGRMPVFSPDGGSLVFFTLRNGGTIRRVSTSGGEAVDIAPGRFPNGAAWGPDNAIVFANNDGPLMRVSANGGTPEPLTTLDADTRAHTRRTRGWTEAPGIDASLTTACRQSRRATTTPIRFSRSRATS